MTKPGYRQKNLLSLVKARAIKNVLSYTGPSRTEPQNVPGVKFILSEPKAISSPKSVEITSIVSNILQITPKIESAKIKPAGILKEMFLEDQLKGIREYQARKKTTKATRISGLATARATLRQERKIGLVASSNVESISYDPSVKKLYVAFLNGSLYEYDFSKMDDDTANAYAEQIRTGANAKCTTEGKSQYNGLRWWVGKSNPSYGAAVWKWLRRTNIPYKRLN